MNIAKRDSQGRIRLLEEENALLLLHLRELREELERNFVLNRGARLAGRVDSAQAAAIPAAVPAPKVNPLLQITDFLRLTIRTKIETLRASGFFDEAWYVRQYPEVARRGRDPIEHYLRVGAANGLNPSPFFDTRWYRQTYPDVARAGFNPLLHYITRGRSEARLPREGAKPGEDISAQGRAMEDLKNLVAAQADEIDRLERELRRMRDEQLQQLAESAKTADGGIGRLVAWSRRYRRWQGTRKETMELANARDSTPAIADRAAGPNPITGPGAT